MPACPSIDVRLSLIALSLVASGCTPPTPTSTDGFTSTFGTTTGTPGTDDATTLIDPSVGEQTSTGGSGGSSSTDPTATTQADDSTGSVPGCGNDAVEGDELCDGTDLGSATCESQGFDGGTLACAEDCSALDTSGCTSFVCGNGAVEGDELCDGMNLDGATCESQGFDGGTLLCTLDCLGLNIDGCTVCGDVIVEAPEVCDGVALFGETCQSQGFDSGELACLPDCTGYDVTGCGECGNGIIEATEECDTADLGGETCLSQGLGNGALGCTIGCQFNVAGCELASGSLLSVRTGDDVLVAIDPLTLTTMDVGPLGVAFDFGEVAWDTTNGVLWMIDGRPQESLYTVDTTTGMATLVGPHLITDLFGLAHDPTTNTVYGSGESPTGFYSMNQMTGAATLIGDPAVAADGLTYDSLRDEIVALAGGGGQMHSIDRMTGAPTLLSSEGFINNCGLAYDPFQDVYWAIDWSGDLYRYDPNAGYTRTLELSGLGSHDGLTYVQGFGGP